MFTGLHALQAVLTPRAPPVRVAALAPAESSVAETLRELLMQMRDTVMGRRDVPMSLVKLGQWLYHMAVSYTRCNR